MPHPFSAYLTAQHILQSTYPLWYVPRGKEHEFISKKSGFIFKSFFLPWTLIWTHFRISVMYLITTVGSSELLRILRKNVCKDCRTQGCPIAVRYSNNHYHNHFYIYGSWVLSLAKLVGWGGKDGGSASLLCWWHSWNTPDSRRERAAPSAGIFSPLLHPRFPGATSSLLQDPPARHW